MIDAHVHFWDPAKFHYAWLSEIPALQRAFEPADLLEAAEGCGLDGAVFVQADCASSRGLEEARWVRQLADTHPWIRGIVAFVALERGEAVCDELERLTGIQQVKGVRRLIQAEAPGFCRQPAFISGVRCLSRFDLSFDLCLKHHQLDEVIALVDACPRTAFVLDHMAKPDIAAQLLEPWRSRMAELARRPNVVCKLSGLVTEADHRRWRRQDFQPYVNHVLEVFGCGRLLYGSDWPVSTLAGGYRAWWDALEWVVGNLSSSEREAVFGANAIAAYRLNSP